MSALATDAPPYTTGSCACGAVKYTITAPPTMQYLCHCRKCKKTSGSAFNANCWVDRPEFRLDQGEEVLKQFQDVDTSKGPMHRHFCSVCAGSIFVVRDDHPDVLTVIGGSMDNFAEAFKPAMEGFTRTKMGWLNDVDVGASYHTLPGEDDPKTMEGGK